MRHPLIDKLIRTDGYPEVTADNLADILAGSEYLMWFFPGDPQKFPETLDVAVILPELVSAFAGAFQPVVVGAELAPELAQRFPFKQWPALVLTRRGTQLGSLCRVLDWSEYLEEIAAMLSPADSDADDAIPSLAI